MRSIGLLKIFFICLFFTFACKKDDAVVVNRVVVFSSNPDQITNNSARLIGNLSKIGDYGVVDHGFVWSKLPKPTLASEGKRSLGPINAIQQFTASVSGLEEGVTYYVRAYATDGKGTRYEGDSDKDPNNFEGTTFSTVSLSVFSFSPAYARPGDIITLKGTKFSLIHENNVVEFGNVKAVVNSVISSTSLTVTVPEGISESAVKLFVTVGGQTSVSYDFFYLINGSWAKKADFPGGARKYASNFIIGDKAYVLLGQDESNALKTDCWQYDALSDTWTEMAPFPGQGLTEAASFTINDKGYILTGQGRPDKKKNMWEYNSATNTWTQKNDFGGTARSGALAFTVNGKVYMGLGNDGSFKNDIWEYNAEADTWLQKTNFPGTGRYGSTSFVIGDLAYVGSGLDGSGVTKDFWSYNNTSDTWSLVASLPGSARYFASGFSINAKGYVGTGYFGTQPLNDLWEYDVTLNAWYQSPAFEGSARYASNSFVINNKAYLGAGISTANAQKDFWEFTTN